MPHPKRHTPTHADGRPLKITFGEMRRMGVRGVLVYCHCGHHTALEADRWGDEVHLSDIEPRFICEGCGSRGGTWTREWLPVIEEVLEAARGEDLKLPAA